MKKSKHLILAGTFDHLHLGHKKYIKKAAYCTQSVSCGLTTNWINKNKAFPLAIQPFQKRLKSIKKFFIKNHLLSKITIFPLKDAFGSAVSGLTMDTIAVTQDSLQGARLVNQKRKLKGLKPLQIMQINLVNAKDRQRISSTRIRSGEINRQGLVYQQLLTSDKTLYLPHNQRHYFKKPLGKLLTGSKTNISWATLKTLDKIKKYQSPFIITVGDITAQAFLINQIPINLAVIDYRCQRKPISFNFHSQLKKEVSFFEQVKNEPGTLSPSTIDAFKKLIPQILTSPTNEQKAIIQVKGEEDLLVLPAVLLAPLKTLIFYGQPDKGLVQIEVTEKIKRKTINLLKKFSY